MVLILFDDLDLSRCVELWTPIIFFSKLLSDMQALRYMIDVQGSHCEIPHIITRWPCPLLFIQQPLCLGSWATYSSWLPLPVKIRCYKMLGVDNKCNIGVLIFFKKVMLQKNKGKANDSWKWCSQSRPESFDLDW